MNALLRIRIVLLNNYATCTLATTFDGQHLLGDADLEPVIQWLWVCAHIKLLTVSLVSKCWWDAGFYITAQWKSWCPRNSHLSKQTTILLLLLSSTVCLRLYHRLPQRDFHWTQHVMYNCFCIYRQRPRSIYGYQIRNHGASGFETERSLEETLSGHDSANGTVSVPVLCDEVGVPKTVTFCYCV